MKHKQQTDFILVSLVFWVVLALLTYYRLDSSWVWILFLGVWFYAASYFHFKPNFWLIYFLVTIVFLLLIPNL